MRKLRNFLIIMLCLVILLPSLEALAEDKSEKNLEVALDYGDGNYKSVYKIIDPEEAIKEAIKLEEDTKKKGSIIPVVIIEDGKVIYSTNFMAKIWKHIKGKPQGILTCKVNIYSDSALTKKFANMNQGYIEDVPIIEDIGTAAKVQINGYNGWINKNKNSDDYDLVKIPITEATNPSYYFSRNGILYHFISYDLSDKEEAGYSIKIGKAPSYFEEGIHYYSYDGIYFYKGNTVLQGLSKLITDLRNNTKNHSINAKTPYYSYFQYLPFRTKTSYTAEELNLYITNNTIEKSKLRGIGKVLIECQNKYGVNPLLILGIAMNESYLGTSYMAINKNNLFNIQSNEFGVTGDKDSFSNIEECVREFAKNYISRGYIDPADKRYFGGYLGNKALGMNAKYSLDPFFGEKVAENIFNIDRTLSNGKFRDYDGYQLALYKGSNNMLNSKGELLYKINSSVNELGGKVGSIVALTYRELNEKSKYEVFPERTTPIYYAGKSKQYSGNYNWKDRGFLNAQNIEFINTPSTPFIPGYKKTDVNKDGEVDIEDLARVSLQYNKSSSDKAFKKYLDLNRDGIIDIFDLIQVSKNM